MSGRSCSACGHVRRPELDEAIVGGESFRAIARRFAPLSRDAIRRHRPHVSRVLATVKKAREGAKAESLLDKVEALESDVHRLRRKAEDEGDLRAALVAVDKLLDIVKFYRELKHGADPNAPAMTIIVRHILPKAAPAEAEVITAEPVALPAKREDEADKPRIEVNEEHGT